MFDEESCRRTQALIALCRERGRMIASAESCTGGLVAGLITSFAGSSDVFERGFVTYSNEAKVECLGVLPTLLDRFGAVSAEVAMAMAVGLLERSHAHISVSITGIAGPGGGSPEKPVGLVHFGCARRGEAATTCEKRFGDLGRTEVRLAAVAVALDLFIQAAGAP